MSAMRDENPFVPQELDASFPHPVCLAPATHEPTPAAAVAGLRFLAELWDDETPQVEPTLLDVIGGKPLLYDGESHSIYGEGGTGKTWIGYEAIKQEAQAGRVSLVVDYESNIRTALLRLKSLGASKDDASRIAYWSFTDSLMPGTESGKAFTAWVDANGPKFVLIDSVARALATAGFDENKNQDYNLWDAGVIAKLVAKRITVLTIDHTGHEGPEGKVKMKAIGASSKANRQSGACYHFEAITHWTRESGGMGKLTCMKDREGHRAKGSVAAEMHVKVEGHGAKLTIEFREPERSASGKVKLTGYWMAVSKLLGETDEPLSGNQVALALIDTGLTSAKRLTPDVLREMESEGYITHIPGPRGSKLFSLVRRYTEVGERPPAGQLHESANVRGF